MRALHVAALVAGLSLLALPEPAAAQNVAAARSANPFLRAPAQRPNLTFTTHTASQRLATARRLAVRANARVTLTSNQGQASDSFVVTPRNGLVANRGALWAIGADLFEPNEGPTGQLWFSGAHPEDAGAAGLQIDVMTPTRLLIECTVWGNNAPFTARVIHVNQQIWSDASTPYNGVISYLTPELPEEMMPMGYFVQLKPAPDQWGMVQSWGLLGCEVTRVSL